MNQVNSETLQPSSPYSPYGHTLTVTTLNVRSIQNESKRTEVFETLLQNNDLVVLTETWLKKNVKYKHANVKMLQTPVSDYHGIVIATKNAHTNLQPVLPDLWTPELAIGRVQKMLNNGEMADLYVIGAYWPPKRHMEFLPMVEAVIEHCRKKSSTTPIILQGDLNIKRQRVDQIANRLDLHVGQQSQEPLPTHFNVSKQSYSQTDYSLVSAGIYYSTCTKEERWSDHNPLTTYWTISTRGIGGRKKRFQRILKRLSTAQELQILQHPSWPNKSYLQVATLLGFTVKIKQNNEITAGLSYIQKKRMEKLESVNRQSQEKLDRYERLPIEQKRLQADKLLHTLMSLWRQQIPRLFLNQAQKPASVLQTKILEAVRNQHPKEFFQAMHQILQTKAKAEIAINFRSTVKNQSIEEAITITEYIKRLYNHDQPCQVEQYEGPKRIEYQITQDQVKRAIQVLGRKATGVDGLDAKVLKRRQHLTTVSEKLSIAFNDWTHRLQVPNYVNTGKLLNLSKDGTAYPPVAQIRTISMGCGVFKILETIVLDKLKSQIREKSMLHPKQRGFQAGKNTLQNIEQLRQLIDRARKVQEQHRRNKIQTSMRSKEYLLFIDLEKAFDKVNRSKLIKVLVDKGVDQELTNIIACLITRTHLKVEDEYVRNNIGVPQGSRLSPVLFTLYIDSLIKNLNDNKTECIGFADDLVVYAPSHTKLAGAIQAVENWSLEAEININRNKSGIMQIRVDKRTPDSLVDRIRGIPVVDNYKYLGIELSDDLNFKLQSDKLQKIMTNSRKAAASKRITKLPIPIRYHSWVTLAHSKMVYGTFLLTPHSPKVRKQYTKFLYQSYRYLLGIRAQPDTERLIESVTGSKIKEIIDREERQTRRLLSESAPKDGQLELPHRQTAKAVIMCKGKHLVQALTNTLFKRSVHKERMHQCHCGQTMSQSHLFDCPQLRKYWQEAAERNNLASGMAMKRLLQLNPTLTTSKDWVATMAEATQWLVRQIKTKLTTLDKAEATNELQTSREHLTVEEAKKQRGNQRNINNQLGSFQLTNQRFTQGSINGQNARGPYMEQSRRELTRIPTETALKRPYHRKPSSRRQSRQTSLLSYFRPRV